ncbi:MAG: flagellar basal body P-ring formation chaperone FlgA [Kofleriaceae bacterium]
MKASIVIVLGALLGGTAAADPRSEAVAAAIADKLQPYLPPNVGVAQVFVPAPFEHASPANVIVQAPASPLRPGRPSIKVTIKHETLYVPVALAAMIDVAVVTHAVASGTVLTAQDISIEHRALAGAPAPAAQVIGATLLKDVEAGTPLGAHDLALPAPTPRGTRVTVDIARGTLHIKGQGTLELAARIGEPATVRLTFNQTIVKGTLIAPGAVVVGDQP